MNLTRDEVRRVLAHLSNHGFALILKGDEQKEICDNDSVIEHLFHDPNDSLCIPVKK